MVTSFTDWDKDPNYLAHFGTKGMKWGQRRFQNPDGSLTSLGKERYGSGGKRSARGMTHDLNKLDRERATAQYRASRYGSKIAKKDARYAKKIAKASESGNERKVAKLKSKQEGLVNTHAGKKAKQYGDLVRKNQAMTNQILSKAKASGMNVSTKQVNRVVNKGRTVAKNIGKLAALTGGLAAYGASGHNISADIRNAAQPKYKDVSGLTGLHTPKFVSVNSAPVTAVRQAIASNSNTIKNVGLAGAGAVGALSGIKTTKGTRYKVKKAKRG